MEALTSDPPPLLSVTGTGSRCGAVHWPKKTWHKLSVAWNWHDFTFNQPTDQFLLTCACFHSNRLLVSVVTSTFISCAFKALSQFWFLHSFVVVVCFVLFLLFLPVCSKHLWMKDFVYVTSNECICVNAFFSVFIGGLINTQSFLFFRTKTFLFSSELNQLEHNSLQRLFVPVNTQLWCCVCSCLWTQDSVLAAHTLHNTTQVLL